MGKPCGELLPICKSIEEYSKETISKLVNFGIVNLVVELQISINER